nr:neutral zinc metallopeptidase [Mycobacteroides salmoniphilum]
MVAVSTIIVLVACSGTVVPGEAVSPVFDPNKAGGLVVTEGPSGMRTGTANPTGTVQGTDHGAMDKLALLSVNDLQEFWKKEFSFKEGSFEAITNLVSYDSEDPSSPNLCGSPTYDEPNAFYCHRNRMMAWDRGAFLPAGQKYFGDISVPGVIAHEYGHAIQRMADLVGLFTPTIVYEQQADCFAGTYMRWVAEGSSPRFAMSTGDGLNHVLAGLIVIRDPIYKPKDSDMLKNGHGTGLDRVTAFQMGFTSGAHACAAIDYDNVKERRGDLPMSLQVDESGGTQSTEASIDKDTIATLAEFLATTFKLKKEPSISYDTSTTCSDAAATPPASYCPSTNIIAIDLGKLKEMGSSANESKRVLVQGDNTAFSIVMSRYMLALQHQNAGFDLNSTAAAMRTACLTGVAQRKMAEPVKLPSGNSLQLAAGDLDEAIAGLLTNGLVASDVNGKAIPAGFTRILAFRAGLLGDANQCLSRFKTV